MGRLPLLVLSLVVLSCHNGSADEIVIDHYTSTYGIVCYDLCDKHWNNYYWCHTRQGWDYCSPAENTDNKGRACRDDHPCGKYNTEYYWCKTDCQGGWNYCGPVEPKTMIHISSTYQRICIDECLYDEWYKYFWCYTDKGWDYCSPTPDVTYKNEPCRSDHPCGSHDYSYSWCWKAESGWDYCGVISPDECHYDTTNLQIRESANPVLFCDRRDKGNKVVTYFYAEPSPATVADGSSIRNEITTLIARWDNGYLVSQARSQLISSNNLRIDLQGLVNRGGQRYYNLQIQMNVPRRSGQSTTVSQVLMPVSPSIPDRYVRMAFVESFRRRAKVTVEVNRCGVNKCCLKKNWFANAQQLKAVDSF